MGETLFEKVWNMHKVGELPNGQHMIFIGRHLIHEVTSPQAFRMMEKSGGKVPFPDRNFATIDHIVPTEDPNGKWEDAMAEEMKAHLKKNAEKYGIKYFDLNSGSQGIVHVIGPELGLTQPGMTIACGDSHTSTHGALGALAFGIGTTQLREVLETGMMALDPLKVHRINYNGKLGKGVTPKDVALSIIAERGVGGGKGFAYEYSGDVFDKMSIEGRMTVCNMSIEGGARIGYVNPDNETIRYLGGREYSPKNKDWYKAVEFWWSIRTDEDAEFDSESNFDANKLEPRVTWGINPGQNIGIGDTLPEPKNDSEREAYEFMGLEYGTKIEGTRFDVAFVGSCTNGRIEDLREAAEVLRGRKVHDDVKMLVVPGSQKVRYQAEQEGLDYVFTEAGAQWREAGCSMCLAMNPDKLEGQERSLSTSNRNFKGRQGSPKGRTHLASPKMVAYSAIQGYIADPRAA